MPRSAAGWPAWAAMSLQLANPASVSLGDGSPVIPVLQTEEGPRVLAYTAQQLQLRWQQCSCTGGGRASRVVWCEHVKYCTPEAVRKPRDLLCVLCAALGTYNNTRRQWPQALHLGFMGVLDAREHRSWLSPADWAWEVRLLPSEWAGRIDIMLLAAGVSVQVDGSGHTRGLLGWDGGTDQEGLDAECAAKHWESGRPLVRLTEIDLGAAGCRLLQWVLQLMQSAHPPSPLIVMGWGYTELGVGEGGGKEMPYPAALAKKLNARCHMHEEPGPAKGVALLTM